MVAINLVPPDGGYGYVIVFAFILNTIIMIPIMQCFGLVFKDRFNELEFSATDTALIINSGVAISMFCGIFNGPLLKLLSYRKTAIISAILATIGVLLTAYANTFIQFIITYSIITSYGMGLAAASYGLAINSYFKKKRAKAVGNALAFCGIGPIVMPQLLTLLMENYDITGTLTIVAGIAMHVFIAAFLLRPVEWYMKKEVIEEQEEEERLVIEEEKYTEEPNNIINKNISSSRFSLRDQVQVETVYGIDTPLTGSVVSLYSMDFLNRSMSISSRKRSITSKFSGKEEDEYSGYGDNSIHETGLNLESMKNDIINDATNKKDNEDLENEQPNLLKRIGKYLVDIFDLTLLKDLTYINIALGMSFAVFAELNFSLLTPFIMQDFNLDTQQTATFMSVISVADVCFRFIAPYVSEFFKQTSRIMYMWTLVLLILSRTSLLLTDAYYGLLACAFFLGVAKGFRTVYWSLVIPDHVPIERLAAALGIQGTLNSILMWIGGSLLGALRDILGSYRYCLLFINLMTLVTIIMWNIEFLYKRLKSRRKVLSENEEK